MKFFYVEIAIALLLAVLTPFLASSDLKGLESTAGRIIEKSKMSQIEETEPVVSSPMPDYSTEDLGKGEK